MSNNRSMIAIFKRQRSKRSTEKQFIGIATNYLEAFRMFHESVGSDDSAHIISGTCKGCRANYARLMQTIKADGSAIVDADDHKIIFLQIKTNQIIHTVNI